MSIKIPEIKDMMRAGLHFGHKTAKWNPKMEEYIYGVKNGVHIFDLLKTKKGIEAAVRAVEDTVARGGVVLFLGTKKQARNIVEKYAKEAETPYVVEHWIGGTLTNFQEIYKLVKKLEDLEKKSEEKDYEEKYTKRERLLFSEEMDNLKLVIGGIRNMKSIPDLIYVAGIRDEKTATTEAISKNIKTVGIVDSNANPDKVSYIIPANDDAIKSLDMITALMAEAIKVGRSKQKKEDVNKKDRSEGNAEQKETSVASQSKKDKDDKLKK